jgi:hypothetical protein
MNIKSVYRELEAGNGFWEELVIWELSELKALL